MGDFDTNIVCGHPAFLERLWTVGMRNIAVIGGGNSTWVGADSVKDVLPKYDEIWTPNECSLYDCVYNTIYVPPWAVADHLSRKR